MSSSPIRKMTALDIPRIRKLPIQLAQPTSTTLIPRRLRAMMHDRNILLVVHKDHANVAGFLAMKIVPDLDNTGRFLVISHFALDPLAAGTGPDIEMEAYAGKIAEKYQAAGLMLAAVGLDATALQFYETLGYQRNDDTLIKHLTK